MALAIPPGGKPSFTPGAIARLTARLKAAEGRLRESHGTSERRPLLRPATPRLSVLVVNFCQWRNTARLVRQLRHSEAIRLGSAEIAIADNHSPFHPVVRRLERLAGVTIRRFNRNHGFARAVNRACRGSRGEWVLLLNPDVTLPDGFLDEVLDTVCSLPATDPTMGVVGFQLRNHDGTRQASSGQFPTLWSTLSGLLRPRSRRKCSHLEHTDRQEVPWVTGGCLLVRRDCFEAVGGLDERFFLYYEDVDFCQRAKEKGWSVWYEPRLQVTHHWPLHARRVPAPLRLMTRHALLTYARKHWTWWQARAMAGIVWLEAGLRQAWAGIRGDTDSARLFGQLRRLVGDVLHGRFDDARKRVRHAAAFLDPLSAEQDGRTE